LFALTLIIVVLSVLRAQIDFISPLDLPSGDVGYYTTQAMAFRDQMVSFNVVGLFQLAAQPEIHPFVHPLLLGAWMVIAGDSQDAVRSYGVAGFALSMVLLVWVCRLSHPRGFSLGLVAVMLTALCTFQRSHLFTAMTEPTSQVIWLLSLGIILRFHGDRRVWPHLLIGLSILVGTLVRYNLFPMLLVPLLLFHLLTHRKHLSAAFHPRFLGWFAPTFVVGIAWTIVHPDLPLVVAAFFVNSPTESNLLTSDHLLWVPSRLAIDFMDSWWLAVPFMVLFIAGSFPMFSLSTFRGKMRVLGNDFTADLRSPPPVLLLQLAVWSSFVALTIHPLKIPRNLTIHMPLFFACALLPWASSNLFAVRKFPLLINACICSATISNPHHRQLHLPILKGVQQ